MNKEKQLFYDQIDVEHMNDTSWWNGFIWGFFIGAMLVLGITIT